MSESDIAQASKRWFKFVRQHATIQPPSSLSNNNYSLDSTAFRLTINYIENLSVSLTQQTAIQFIINLYDPKTNQFFGRTHESEKLDIIVQPTKAYSHVQIAAYFHLKLDQNVDCHFVIEAIQLFKDSNDVITSRRYLGWGSYSFLSEGEYKLQLKKGSARVLAMSSKPTCESTSYAIFGAIIKSEWFNSVKQLVPEGALCGTGDEILGLQDSYIPLLRNNADPTNTFMNNITIYISNIEIQIPHALEATIVDYIKQLLIKKYQENENHQVEIVKKRLVVGFHNGWTLTNNKGFLNSVQLIESSIEQQDFDGHLVEYWKLVFPGAIDVNRVFYIDQMTQRSLSGMLILQLQYDISFLVTNIGRQNITVYIGWIAIPIQQFEAQCKSKTIEESFILGPGKTLDGRALLDLSKHSNPVVFRAIVNFGNKEITVKQQLVKQRREDEKPDESKYFKKVQEVEKKKQIIKKKEQLEQQFMRDNSKIKELESTLQKLQQERQVSQNTSREDYERQLRELSLREKNYQKMLEDIQGKHKEEINETLIQYEELKKMMEELQHTQQLHMGRSQAGASLSLAKYSESLMFEQTDLDKWRIIESMTSVPRQNYLKIKDQAFSIEPTFGGKILTRGEIAFLAQNGVKGLLETGSKDLLNDELEAKNLEIEYQDQKKASAFYFQFLAFKPKIAFINQAIDQDYQLESIYHEEVTIPKKLIFTINFFDFPLLHTEGIVFENGIDQFQFRDTLKSQQPFLLVREAVLSNQNKELKEPIYKFEMEPSSSTNPNQHVKLVQFYFQKMYCQYLYHKQVTIEMWDSESLLIFGTIKIPLKFLLRQGRPQSTITKNVDIIDPTFTKVKGQLQLLVKNIGRHDHVQEVPMQNFNQSSEFSKTNPSMKRKVLSNQPLDPKTVLLVASHTQAFNDEGGDTQLQQFDPQERIKERIRRFKLTRFSSGIDSEKDTAANISAKQAQLNEINKFKEQKKQTFIKSVIQDHIKDERVYHVLFGQCQIIPLEFRNMAHTTERFLLQIEDPDQQIIGLQEISLIYSQNEWKFFADLENYPEPADYSAVEPTNDLNNFILNLRSNEMITLLFKYISFRDVDTSYSTIQKSEEILAFKGKDYMRKYCYPRQIVIYINQQVQNFGGLRILMHPHKNIIDHIFRFNERDNHQVKLQFPALYSYKVTNSEKRPLLYATEKNVSVEWANDFEVKVGLRVPEVRRKLEFYILAYVDQYFKEQIGNWFIQVNSLSGVGIEVPLGQVTTSKLTVHCDVARQVKLFSSHPLTEKVWFPQPEDKKQSQGLYKLEPGKINILLINLRSFSEKQKRVLVNCVDQNSKELVYSWILNIVPTVPAVSKLYEVKCPNDQPKNFVFPYQNRLNQEFNLIFLSSHPDILMLIESKYFFKAGEKQEIRLRIQRKSDLQNIEVKIFICDENRTKETYDCILFKIEFVIIL